MHYSLGILLHEDHDSAVPEGLLPISSFLCLPTCTWPGEVTQHVLFAKYLHFWVAKLRVNSRNTAWRVKRIWCSTVHTRLVTKIVQLALHILGVTEDCVINNSYALLVHFLRIINVSIWHHQAIYICNSSPTLLTIEQTRRLFKSQPGGRLLLSVQENNGIVGETGASCYTIYLISS
jgi:hypothetical protein